MDDRIDDLVNGAPAAFDTLKEIADVLQGNVGSIGDIFEVLETKWTQDDAKIANWDSAYSWGNHASAGYAHLAGEETFTGLKHFTAGLSVGAGKHKLYEKDGVVYFDGDLAVTGGITQYAVDPANVSDLMDNIRTDGTTIRVNPDTKELEVIGGIGIDLSAMWDALSASTSEQINRSHLTTALQGYATEDWVTEKNYAVKATTLAGYGITDAYTKTESDGKYLLKTSYTAADILAKLKTVDGSGSGLDADLLDGKHNGELNGFLNTKALPYTSKDKTNWWCKIATIKITAQYTSKEALLLITDAYTTTTNSVYGFVYIKVQQQDSCGNMPNVTLRVFGSIPKSNIEGRLTLTSTSSTLDVYFKEIFLYQRGYLSFVQGSEDIRSVGELIQTLPTATHNILCENDFRAGRLENPRTLWGRSFDGTANISGELSSVTGIRFSAGERFDTNGNIILPSTGGAHNWNVFNSSGNAAFKVYANGITDMYIANIGEYLLYNNEATLKIYSDYNPSSPTEYGKETACIQTSFDGQDPTTSTYPGLYPGRCVLALQPRGGWVGIGLRNPTTVLDVNGDIQANGWVRTKGNAGWYAQDWGGGIYMSDSTWVRIFNGKNFRSDNVVEAGTWLSAGIAVNVFDPVGNSWNNGQGAYQVAIPTNSSQTPILVAYNGPDNSSSGTNRYFAIEVLNNGTRDVHFCVTGEETVRMKSNWFEVNGNFYASDNVTGRLIYRDIATTGVSAPNFFLDNRPAIKCEQDLAVIANDTVRPILRWGDAVSNVGYNTRYVIGSVRQGHDWGRIFMAVSNNDNGTSEGCSFSVYGSGYAAVNGNFLATGGITQYSDQRAKTIIEQINLSLMDIANSPAVRFKWNGYKDRKDDGKTHVGGIAQYIQKILPEVIYNSDDLLTMDYATTGYIFSVNTAKHLLNYETKTDKEINKLKERIRYLENQLKKLGYEEADIVDN